MWELAGNGDPRLIEELQRRLNRRDMVGKGYHTVAGFVLARLGRIPKAGDTLSWRDLRVEIVDMDGVRIDKILLGKADPHVKKNRRATDEMDQDDSG